MLVPDALRLRGEERYRRLLEGEGGAIDAGSYGRVYMAIDLATQREVALKRQPLPSSTAAREFATFRALAEYPHPNVITMLDSFVHAIRGQDFLYMAIELCDSSLWHLFGTPRVKHGRLDTAEVLRLVRGAATGLTHLHGLGITHGDISLKNLLLSRGTLKIADFGTAHTAHGFIVPPGWGGIATAYARPPELFLRIPESACSVDLWSLGVVCLCLATGQCPWLWDTTDEAILLHLLRWAGPVTEGACPALCAAPGWGEVRAFPGVMASSHDAGSLAERARHLPTAGPRPQGDLAIEAVARLLILEPSARPTAEAASLTFLAAPRAQSPAPPPAQPPPEPPTADSSGDGLEPHTQESEKEPENHTASSRHRTASSCDRTASSRTPCQCSGNCFPRSVCRVNLNARRYREVPHLCPGEAAPGATLCAWCKCGADGCPKPHLCGHRWCTKHRRDRQTRANYYATPFGVDKYDPQWSDVLKMTVFLHPIYPLLRRDDLDASLELQTVVGIKRGGAISAPQLLYLFLAHAIKWPPSVRHWHRLLTASLPQTARDLVAAFRATIKWSSGRRWPSMFSRMNSGRACAQTGIAVHGVCLGLLGPPRGDCDICQLGPAGKEYGLVPEGSPEEQLAISIVESYLACAREQDPPRDREREREGGTGPARSAVPGLTVRPGGPRSGGSRGPARTGQHPLCAFCPVHFDPCRTPPPPRTRTGPGLPARGTSPPLPTASSHWASS